MDAIFAGLIGGLISPLVLSIIRQFFVWKVEKRLALKEKVFDEAVTALSKRYTDALDLDLQQEKRSVDLLSRETYYQPGTIELLERSRIQIKTFFSSASYETFNSAANCELSIKNVPNIEFEELRIKSIISLSKEIEVNFGNWWETITNKGIGQ